MAKFVFKLEAALKQRKLREDQAQRVLSEHLQRQVTMENELREMQEDIRQDRHMMTQSLMGQVDVDRIRSHATHTGQVTIRARELLMRLYGVHRLVEEARRLLMVAQKDRKAIELLKERAFEQWKREQSRLEQQQLDEMATQAYFRNARGADR